MSSRHQLVSRLEKAAGPDRQLDLDITISLGLLWNNNDSDVLMPAWTERLDQVEAYIRRHLPDASWSSAPTATCSYGSARS